MDRIQCIISYDGTNFSGYQIQPNGRTVQAEVEKALTRMHKGLPIRVIASGRTDARVHAVGQVIHFDTSLNIPIQNWRQAFNALLPEDIRVKEVKRASNEFHARYDVVEKEYRYFILNTENEDVFLRNYTYHVRQPLDMKAMSEACDYLEGTHDFTSFCAANTSVKDKTRTLYDVSCFQEDGKVVFVFKGSGFLYNMVRILVGTLIEVGKGKRPPLNMKRVIDLQDRGAAGKTAPPQGLYLWNVNYEKRLEN
ncbi:tRNA pseudouridine(38-40) synthase TruA [Aquibacillus albus]|uniref:tRNA pseudouridine synthase A n=1 Tax=Aquibacillus albus TaxID=1168171 RepID=A0ABS2N599_9BACI|nr:tRNA pseudouridine(38-40) synthase TruA [Aquibacillus albus]MBM7573060.1 tRNA pseudouridine38-40 synthase [Aquibacillus albus]